MSSKLPAPVIELSYGPDWYAHARNSASAAPAVAPAEFAGYTGHYYAESPWCDNVRVVLRRGQLWLGGTAPLMPAVVRDEDVLGRDATGGHDFVLDLVFPTSRPDDRSIGDLASPTGTRLVTAPLRLL